jgi:hypothetical protein
MNVIGCDPRNFLSTKMPILDASSSLLEGMEAFS